VGAGVGLNDNRLPFWSDVTWVSYQLLFSTRSESPIQKYKCNIRNQSPLNTGYCIPQGGKMSKDRHEQITKHLPGKVSHPRLLLHDSLLMTIENMKINLWLTLKNMNFGLLLFLDLKSFTGSTTLEFLGVTCSSSHRWFNAGLRMPSIKRGTGMDPGI
jgi:hypothetical protein